MLGLLDQFRRSNLLDQGAVQRIGPALPRHPDRLENSERWIVENVLLLHSGKEPIGDRIPFGAVLDSVDACVKRIGYVSRAAGVANHGKSVLTRGFDDGVKQRGIEAWNKMIRPPTFEDRLDSIHSVLLERVDLLLRFIGGFGETDELLFEALLHLFRHVLDVFRAVAAWSCEHRADGEQLGSELLAGSDRCPVSKHCVGCVAHALYGRDATVEIGGKFAINELIALGVFGGVLPKSARRPEMDMDVDQPGEQSLSGGIDHTGFLS